MRNPSLTMSLAAGLLTGSAPLVFAQAAPATQAASTTAANDLAAPDKAFVQAATMANSMEIDASKMAMKQSFNSKVKNYARTMIVEHMKLSAQLKAAAPHAVAIPSDNSDEAALAGLQKLQGKAFDDAYIKQIALEGHKKTIAAFEAEISQGQNADLKSAAQSALPTIKKHYAMAQQLANKKGSAAIVD